MMMMGAMGITGGITGITGSGNVGLVPPSLDSGTVIHYKGQEIQLIKAMENTEKLCQDEMLPLLIKRLSFEERMSG